MEGAGASFEALQHVRTDENRFKQVEKALNSSISEWNSGEFPRYNTTGAPKISLSVPLETSGIIEVKQPMATIEDAF